MKTILLKWSAILFALLIVLIIVLANTDNLGFLRILNQIPFGDKAGHFILYGILTLLIDLALFQTLRNLSRRLIVLRVALILSLFIGIEEFSQQFFPSRSFDLIDLTFSYIGVAFFSWLALRIKS